MPKARTPRPKSKNAAHAAAFLRLDDAEKPPFIRQLPKWIYADPGYAALDAGRRFALHIIGGRCSKADVDGDLLPCYVGALLFAEIGCSRATFWRYATDLERHGFIVCVGRGGALGTRGNAGDTLAIPGRKGALDDLRVTRRANPNGPGGDAPILWTIKAERRAEIEKRLAAAAPTEIDIDPVSNCDGTPSQIETLVPTGTGDMSHFSAVPASQNETAPVSNCDDPPSHDETLSNAIYTEDVRKPYRELLPLRGRATGAATLSDRMSYPGCESDGPGFVEFISVYLPQDLHIIEECREQWDEIDGEEFAEYLITRAKREIGRGVRDPRHLLLSGRRKDDQPSAISTNVIDDQEEDKPF